MRRACYWCGVCGHGVPLVCVGPFGDLVWLPCPLLLPRCSPTGIARYAAVDIDDVMGRRRENVTEHVMKWTIDHAGEMKDFVESVPPEPEFRHSACNVPLATYRVLGVGGLPWVGSQVAAARACASKSVQAGVRLGWGAVTPPPPPCSQRRPS
jgi:hypothetical protein